MKWVTFISFIFLVSSIESKHLPRRSRDAGPIDTIGHCYSEIQNEDFKGIALMAIIHLVPNVTYDDMERMVEDITELGKKCAADAHADPDCTKSIDIIIPEELCHEHSIAERYGYSECCSKAGHERNECLLSHRSATAVSFPPYQRPAAEATCRVFEENRLNVLGHFLYEVTRRNLDASTLLLFLTTSQYEEKVLVPCCQAENKTACFKEKAPAVKKQMKLFGLIEKQNCFLLKKFGAKNLQSLKFVQAAQKFPKAEHSILVNISREIVHIHEERCRGDMLESFVDQIALTKFVCEHQDTLSSKAKGCCEKDLLQRPFCLVAMDNDDLPADLSPRVPEFLDSTQACPHYAENHEKHLEGFMYQYARRHAELSPQMILRLREGYEDFLKKCCHLESAAVCLTEAEPMLRKHIADSLEFVRTNCEQYTNLGDYHFRNALLIRYTRKAPTLKFEELDEFTQQLHGVATKCCPLGDEKKLTCAEQYTDIVLGNICLRHQEHAINHKICQCCSSTYAFRRQCFSAIEVDDGYTPAPCNADIFTFHEDLCTAAADVAKRKLLVDLVKCKPAITAEQMKTTTSDFNALVSKCCEAENHEQCFHDEGPKLVEKTQAALN